MQATVLHETLLAEEVPARGYTCRTCAVLPRSPANPTDAFGVRFLLRHARSHFSLLRIPFPLQLPTRLVLTAVVQKLARVPKSAISRLLEVLTDVHLVIEARSGTQIRRLARGTQNPRFLTR